MGSGKNIKRANKENKRQKDRKDYEYKGIFSEMDRIWRPNLGAGRKLRELPGNLERLLIISNNEKIKIREKKGRKRQRWPDTPGNITDDDQEKSSSTVCNSISKSHDRENKKKKTEKVDDEKIIEIDLNYDIEIEKKEKPKSEEKRNKEEMLDIVIKDEKDEKDVNKDFSGIKVKKINNMKIPENPNDGISFNIKFKKQGKTFIENFNTKNDSIPNECLAKYYEMFIRENFKGCTFSKEMIFEWL